MTGPIHELPQSILLEREEYRGQHDALEIALDLLDQHSEIDRDGRAREALLMALSVLLHKIWPLLDDLDGDR